MVLQSSTTGSSELAPILFISGEQALKTYGISLEYCKQCPKCHAPLNQLLSFNPTNSYRYLAPCAVCGQFVEYMDNTGKLTNFATVLSGKTTPLDEDTEVWHRY